MELHKPISPTEFRLFFNRFAIDADQKWEIRIPNQPEFQMTANMAGEKIVEALKDPLLTIVQRCRLLDDLGTVSLLIAFENDQEHSMVERLAISIQNTFLEKNNMLAKGAWKEAEALHPLVHIFATYWRAVPFGPPSPLQLTSEDKIADYLLQIASKTPEVVDKLRLLAVKEFLKKPSIIKNIETTQKLQQLFLANWFPEGKLAPKVIDVPEQYALRKLVPDMPFGDIQR